MKDKTKNIVEQATTLFTQHGLYSVTMDDIASFSGISKKTLYVNFQSKEMLVNTIVQKLISKTSKYIGLSPDISPNAINEMENFSEHILGVVEILTPKFIRELKKYYPEAYAQLVVFRDNSIIPYLERCLRRGINEEIFRPEIDKPNVGWLYCWQIQNVLEGPSSHPDVSRFIRNNNDLFLHAILNSKGIKLISMKKQNGNSGRNEKPGSG